MPASHIIGHRQLDEDHDRMIQVWRELEASRTLAAAKAAVVRLTAEATGHFAREEAVMAECGFPGLARHRALHRDMEASLRKVLLSPLLQGAEHEDFVTAVRSLFSKWINVHILAEDARLIPYIRQAAMPAARSASARR